MAIGGIKELYQTVVWLLRHPNCSDQELMGFLQRQVDERKRDDNRT